MRVFLYTLALLACLQSSNNQMQRVILKDQTALCLDGSPGVYYIEKGQYPKTVVVYFQGGGWCGDRDLASTLQNCYQRSKTNYGSSKSYPPTLTFTEGILSTNEKNQFRLATRVVLRYCDGSGHQGTRSSPIVYKDSKLYFRGNNITIAQLEDLQAKIGLFSQATEIIVTGGSAGGLAAFTWADYIRDRAKVKNVYAVPDSGIFLDSKTFDTQQNAYSNQFQNLFKLSNTQINPPTKQCVKAYPKTPYKCMMAQYLVPYIQTPIFAIQSLYDSWSIPYILNIKCLQGSSMQKCSQAQKQYIESYHRNTTKVLMQIAGKEGNGAWAPACITHGFVHDARYYSLNYRVPMRSENSIDETLVDWVEGKGDDHVYIDQQNWPDNQPCSGLTLNLMK